MIERTTFSGSRKQTFDNIGAINGQFLTWNDIAREARLDFQPVKAQFPHPDFVRRAWNIIDALQNHGSVSHTDLASLRDLERTSAFATLRSDTRGFIGAVGNGYTPIDHATGFSLIDELVGSVDGAHYETAGSINNGQRVWGLANLGESTWIQGTADKTDHYLLFSTSHDGSSTWDIRPLSYRLWCGNALDHALEGSARRALRIRHTKNAETRMREASALISAYRTECRAFGELMNALARRSLGSSENEVKLNTMHFLQDAFRLTQEQRANPASVPTNTWNAMGKVIANMESADNGKASATRHTAYALLQAYTEYIDYHRATRVTKSASEHGGFTRTEQVRGVSAIFGDGATRKRKALEIIKDLAPSLPEHRLPDPVHFDLGGQAPALTSPAAATSTRTQTPIDRLLELVDVD